MSKPSTKTAIPRAVVSHGSIKLLGRWRLPRFVEIEVHGMLSGRRLQGEWFSPPVTEIKALISDKLAEVVKREVEYAENALCLWRSVAAGGGPVP